MGPIHLVMYSMSVLLRQRRRLQNLRHLRPCPTKEHHCPTKALLQAHCFLVASLRLETTLHQKTSLQQVEPIEVASRFRCARFSLLENAPRGMPAHMPMESKILRGEEPSGCK